MTTLLVLEFNMPFFPTARSLAARFPFPFLAMGLFLLGSLSVACMDGPVETCDNCEVDGGVTPDVDAGDVEPNDEPKIALVSAAEVNDLLDDDTVQIVDMRSAADFSAGHIPGAIHLDGNSFRTTVAGIPGQVVSRADAISTLEAAGVDPDLDLVIVGAANDTATSRVLWTAFYFGANNLLMLLDDGYGAWLQGNFATSTDTEFVASDWSATQTVENGRVDKQYVLDHLDDDNVTLFDVRTPGEFTTGHIPGAINVNWQTNLDVSGSFISIEDIRANHGDPTTSTIVVYCQSGARASVSWTLLNAAGYEDVRLYDGSWNEWGTDDTTPKETGE